MDETMLTLKTGVELIEQDGGPRDVLLSVYNTSLHCLLVLDGQGTPDHIADAAIQLGRDLIAQTEDDEYRAGIEWRLGTGLWLAAQVAYRQEHADAALEFANNAEVLLASAGKSRSESPESAHHLAQLRFLTGSIYAINRQDDASADDGRTAAQAGVVTLLDRGEEGVGVRVQDGRLVRSHRTYVRIGRKYPLRDGDRRPERP